MGSLPPLVRRLIRFAVVGTGALFIASGVVNIIGAWQLIDPDDEKSLGITRSEIVWTYAVFVIVGAVLVWLGLRRWKKR